SYAYQKNLHIISSLATIGLVGIIGLTIGLEVAQLRRVRLLGSARRARTIEDRGSFGIVTPLLFSPVALFFSLLSSPEKSILTSFYSDTWSKHRGESIGFAGGGVLAYSVLALLAVDAFKEDLPILKFIKLGILASTFSFILVFFQILRGTRDILGL